MTLPRPTEAELKQAANRRLPDLLAPGLTVLFCGINPGLYSAALGYHFARPGNRFWRALHAAGYTDRILGPEENHILLQLGYGLTDIVARPSARAEELSTRELRAGAGRLEEKVRQFAPRWVAILGITAYRLAFQRPKAALGPQPEPLAGSGVWVLPNPSGLNAHHPPRELAKAMRRLRLEAAGSDGPTQPS